MMDPQFGSNKIHAISVGLDLSNDRLSSHVHGGCSPSHMCMAGVRPHFVRCLSFGLCMKDVIPKFPVFKHLMLFLSSMSDGAKLFI